MKNFQIGTEIFKALTTNSSVSEMIATRVYPIVADQGTTYPFVVYKRTRYNGNYANKDFQDEIVNVEIIVVATGYENAVATADRVAECLINYRSTIVSKINLLDIYEAYEDNNYVQKMQFEIFIN